MMQNGESAPDFELLADGGGTVRLNSFRGRPVVLYFYPKDDTSGCTKEAVAFSERLADFAKLGAEVIGVSPDSVASHDAFKAKHGLTVTLASDSDTAVAHAYGVWVEKNMYGRRYMGVDRSTFLIDEDGKVAHVWRGVKVPGHVDDVLEVLEALGARRA